MIFWKPLKGIPRYPIHVMVNSMRIIPSWFDSRRRAFLKFGRAKDIHGGNRWLCLDCGGWDIEIMAFSAHTMWPLEVCQLEGDAPNLYYYYALSWVGWPPPTHRVGLIFQLVGKQSPHCNPKSQLKNGVLQFTLGCNLLKTWYSITVYTKF